MEEFYFARAGIASAATMSYRASARAPWLSFTAAHALPVDAGASMYEERSAATEADPAEVQAPSEVLPGEVVAPASTARPGPTTAALTTAQREPEPPGTAREPDVRTLGEVADGPPARATRTVEVFESAPGGTRPIAGETVLSAGVVVTGPMGPAVVDRGVERATAASPEDEAPEPMRLEKNLAASRGAPVASDRPGAAPLAPATGVPPPAVKLEAARPARHEASPVSRAAVAPPMVSVAARAERVPERSDPRESRRPSPVREGGVGVVGPRPSPSPSTEREIPLPRPSALETMGGPLPRRNVAIDTIAARSPVGPGVADQSVGPVARRVHIGTLHVTVKSPPAPAARVAPAPATPAPRAWVPHRDPWDAAFGSFH